MSGAGAVFGKLPAHGDFVSRGLEDAARARWDALLSEGLERARRALGDGFEAAHDGAPPWRFVAAPDHGLATGWVAGALAPSVDRVGRRFFLVALRQGLDAGIAARDGAALAAGLEDALFVALADALDADALLDLASRAGAGGGADGPMTAGGRWWTLGGDERPAQTLDGPADPARIAAMISPALQTAA